MFSGSSNIESYASGKNVRNVKMPGVSSRSEEDSTHDSGDQTETRSSISVPLIDHQIPNLVTLSLLPRSQWQSLSNLDIIKLRNKPIEPPKKPEKAPFFLPTTPSLSGEIQFNLNAVTNGNKEEAKYQKLLHDTKISDLSSAFSLLLQSCSDTKNCKNVLHIRLSDALLYFNPLKVCHMRNTSVFDI